MIFVATGTQFPFDRLVRYLDEWVASNKADNKHSEAVFMQLGEGDYLPQHTQWKRFMGLEDYNEKIKQSSVFISHAGMGNIISAKDHGVPIIVINRQASLGEHRNDHQQEGLAWMAELEGVYTASTQEALYGLLDQRETLRAGKKSHDTSLTPLIDYLKSVL
ncbi:MAG TPA: glycosyl transferase family 28 [Thiothrix sp.]|nr:glycosyl transferase family 28 [Thiothrix sp.]